MQNLIQIIFQQYEETDFFYLHINLRKVFVLMRYMGSRNNSLYIIIRLSTLYR